MSLLSIKRIFSNEVVVVAAVTVLCLAPFIGKAFHIDDPMFIWPAKHIQEKPLDFYGFEVNWYGTIKPMALSHDNPPGASYYMALVGRLFGFSEVVLHIGFLLPAVAMALGTYYLAREFCSRGVLAAVAAVVTPGFVVSSTNVMCDTMMAAFFVWAIFVWVRGINKDKKLYLLLGAVLVVMCALTKLFGVALLPLLFVYSVIKKRRVGVWILFLLISVAALAGYQWVTSRFYGVGAFSNAVSAAGRIRGDTGWEFFSKMLVGFSFTGGCIITLLFYWPLLSSKRVTVFWAVLAVVFIVAPAFGDKIGATTIRNEDGVIKWGFLIQFGLMTVGGIGLFALAVADFVKRRSADSLLLLLWVFGTFAFAIFVNWSINARSILPMVPAAGILLMRQIDRRSEKRGQGRKGVFVYPLIAAAIVSLLVGWADYQLANAGRQAANKIVKTFENREGTLWFQGHWGFQYYMESAGATSLDYMKSTLKTGDILVIPSNNTNIHLLPERMARLTDTQTFDTCRWLSTMSEAASGGFYADSAGALPFGIGPVEPENYYIYIIR